MSDFETAFDRVIGHEGNYQNNPNDSGNWTGGEVRKGKLKGTKFGISASSYPDINIKSLTIEKAQSIYKEDYWDRLYPDVLPFNLLFQLFDSSINHGHYNTIRILQEAVGAKIDGLPGPKTHKAIKNCNKNEVPFLFLSKRLESITEIDSWNHFSKGWARRIALNMDYACADSY